MQADAALRILRGSFEPLIMENDRCDLEYPSVQASWLCTRL